MIIDIVLVFAMGRGGLEDVIKCVSNGLVKRGHKVRVFLAHEPLYKEWENSIDDICYYGKKNQLDEETYDSLIQGYRESIMDKGIPDIVIATQAPTLSYICNKAVECFGETRPNIISWLHGNPRYYGGEEFLNYSDAHLAISNEIAMEIRANVNDKNNIYYVGNPVEIENVKEVKMEKNKLELIYIGRLNNLDKRIDILFKALSIIEEPWHLQIIGDGADNAMLLDLAISLNINDKISWLGWLENPWEGVTCATALVLSSDEEGFGLVMVEALARGIPVISSDIAGSFDIIESGKNGLIFKKGDYNELAYRIKEMKNVIKDISAQQCKESVKKFRKEIVIEKIEKVIERYNKSGDYYKYISEIKAKIEEVINKNEILLAKKLIDEYSKIDSEDIDLESYRGIVCIMNNEYDEAYGLFKKALNRQCDNLDLLYNMGYVCELLDKQLEALKYYNDILIYDSNKILHDDVKEKMNKIYDKYDSDNKKITVDIVLHYISGRGGTEYVVESLAKELIQRGHRVRVFQSYIPEYREWIEVIDELYFYGIGNDYREETTTSLVEGYSKKIAELGAPDIILATHLPVMSYVCKKAIEILNIDYIPVLSWIHIDPMTTGGAELVNFADGNISISQSISNNINKLVNKDKAIYFVGNPVNDEDAEMVERSDDDIKLIYIGRLENIQKRVDVLFNALALLGGEWELKIIGDGEHKNNLKELAVKLGIDNNIQWLGWQVDPWKCVEHATALVLPSDFEGFGIVSVEALQRGIPIIVSRCVGSIDIVKDYENGYSFNIGDHEELYKILYKIRNRELNLPSEESCKLSVKEYSVNNVINKIEFIIKAYNQQ